ncbi:MAG: Asp-tRNA(Asn)/Glu-tRNA(Gln) amidotransferase subunit GatB [bacterium]|nr:Asp-tRNA(Asn)/Glu-tRNA(Gln) amidotransferase subunit GatB [bacterium]
MKPKQKITPIIGLEVHIELKSESKMFCSCEAEHFGVEPNTHTCPVCLALPGALPYANKKAIEATIIVGLTLNCDVTGVSKFDRKNYFYPDLPKGYQISQYDMPLAKNGKCKIEKGKWIRIRRVHLEEDTGKLIHTEGASLIDYNRAGVPLMEIVSEPDFESADEVKSYLQKLQQLVRSLGLADADMEKGQMRCEPNVNLKIEEEGNIFFTPIAEIKNVNSFRFVSAAINHEINRQLLHFNQTRIEKGAGNKETRGWDEKNKVTFPQRAKEESSDYRYFPEPDIPPLEWSNAQIDSLKNQISELPDAKKERFMKTYTINEESAKILTENQMVRVYFEEAVEIGSTWGIEPREVANMIINKRLDMTKLTPLEFIEEINKAKQKTDMSEGELIKIIDDVLGRNISAVEDYKKGKTNVLDFLVGQVARETKGKSDSNQTRKLLLEKLQ